MITKEEIKDYAKTYGLKPWQAEKEYFQHMILHLIYSNTSSLLFKGGTAIKKAYGLKRFSEDLDFTQIGEIDADTLFDKISKDISIKYGYITSLKKMKVKEEIGVAFRFSINGPLLEPSGLGQCYIYIEISKREVPKTREVITIRPIYPDLPDYTVLIMSKEEILAEKVRAITTRDKARDLYDLWYLLSQGIKIKQDWINEKMIYYKLKFSKKSFYKELEKYKKSWNDMGQLTNFVPTFDEVMELVHKGFDEVYF